MPRAILVVACLAAILAGLNPAHAQSATETFQLPADLLEKSISLSTPSPSTLPETLGSTGRYGLSGKRKPILQTKDIWHISRTTTGLYVISAESRFLNQNGRDRGGSASTALSLCGLIPLMSQTSSSSKNLGAFSANGLKFYISTTTDIATFSWVSGLESSSQAICSISPGGAFEYTIESNSEMTISAVLHREKAISNPGVSKTTRCTAASETEPAHRVSPLLSGDSILVTCNTTDLMGNVATLRYAYLTDYHFYLPMGSNVVAPDAKGSYSDIVYDRIGGDEAGKPERPH